MHSRIKTLVTFSLFLLMPLSMCPQTLLMTRQTLIVPLVKNDTPTAASAPDLAATLANCDFTQVLLADPAALLVTVSTGGAGSCGSRTAVRLPRLCWILCGKAPRLIAWQRLRPALWLVLMVT